MKTISSIIIGLALTSLAFGTDLVDEIPLEKEGEMPILWLAVWDGGSFSIPMDLQSGKRKALWIDRSYEEIDLGMGEKQLVPKKDGYLYWGTDNFENRIPFKGERELVKSMIRAIQVYLASKYPEEDLETILFEKEKDHLALILERLHEMNNSNKAMERNFE